MTFFETVERLSRRQKQAVAIVIDAVMLPLALWSAIALRLGEWMPPVSQFWPAFVASVVIGVPAFFTLGLYRHVIRYVGSQFAFAVIKGVTVATAGIAAVDYLAHVPGFPRSAPMIFWVLSLFYVAGTRYLVRLYAESVAARPASADPVAIYGAGAAGVELARHLLAGQGDSAQRPMPVAFVDDNPALHGSVIHGLSVHGPEAIDALVEERGISQVLVAMPSATPAQRRRVLESLERYPVRVRLLPDLHAIVSGAEALTPRDVDIADLLDRDPVAPLAGLLSGSVTDRVVLVTGAGGSIGSELCRQILPLSPRLLVLMDQSEIGLFNVQRELLELGESADLSVPVASALGSVGDRPLVGRVFAEYGVQTVYHAAAYKHVGLVEQNVVAGLRNNAFGTLSAAQAAVAAGVENFILISTDKAVRTENVMGATKRLAEMVLQSLQDRAGGATRFSMVRFGNVLGSSGSVVPLFREQIIGGGPVLLSHPEVTRYFMTIPEAAQLVLQAASMARGGDVFLLDMGEPVKIRELAVRMIHLYGCTVRDERSPDGEIELQVIGLKPGEKLREELLVGNDSAEPTEHPKIMRAFESCPSWAELGAALDRLRTACDEFDVEAVRVLLDGLVEDANLGRAQGSADVLQMPRRTPGKRT